MLEEGGNKGSMRSCSGSGDGQREQWFGGCHHILGKV